MPICVVALDLSHNAVHFLLGMSFHEWAGMFVALAMFTANATSMTDLGSKPLRTTERPGEPCEAPQKLFITEVAL